MDATSSPRVRNAPGIGALSDLPSPTPRAGSRRLDTHRASSSPRYPDNEERCLPAGQTEWCICAREVTRPALRHPSTEWQRQACTDKEPRQNRSQAPSRGARGESSHREGNTPLARHWLRRCQLRFVRRRVARTQWRAPTRPSSLTMCRGQERSAERGSSSRQGVQGGSRTVRKKWRMPCRTKNPICASVIARERLISCASIETNWRSTKLMT